MKTAISFMFTVILTLSFTSCKDKDESHERERLEAAKSKYISEFVFRDPRDEIIDLLSIKYDLSRELAHRVIKEFTEDDSLQNYFALAKTTTLKEFESLRAKLVRPSVAERIRTISLENNVAQSKIASLLIDFRIWYEAQHDETYRQD